MQRFPVVYHGISHYSLVFYWYTQQPLGGCGYQIWTSGSWTMPWYTKRAVNTYFKLIPYHKKYFGQNNQCDICRPHDGKVGCNTVVSSNWLAVPDGPRSSLTNYLVMCPLKKSVLHRLFYFLPKLRVLIKDNNNSPHGNFHRFLFPFSSKFPDLTPLHMFSVFTHVMSRGTHS